MKSINVFQIILLFPLIVSCISYTAKIEKYHNPQKALLVIDMQIDYIDENGKFPINKNQIDDLIVTVNKIINDCNSKDYKIIYIRNNFKKNNIKNIFRNYAVIEGTMGANIDPRIIVISTNIFDKYSPSAFSNRYFENYLMQNQIEEVYLCGVKADECVFETALEAFNKNYRVNYISNAVGSSSAKNIERAIRKLKTKGINIIEL